MIHIFMNQILAIMLRLKKLFKRTLLDALYTIHQYSLTLFVYFRNVKSLKLDHPLDKTLINEYLYLDGK